MVKIAAQTIKMEDMIGRRVLSKSREVVGEIKDVVLDQLTGNCAYVAISCGGVLGIGAKLYAFLWQDVQYDIEESAYVINLSKKQLEARDSFPSLEWPDRVESLSKDKDKPKISEKAKKPTSPKAQPKADADTKATKTPTKSKQEQTATPVKATKLDTKVKDKAKSKPTKVKVAGATKAKAVPAKAAKATAKPKRATKS